MDDLTEFISQLESQAPEEAQAIAANILRLGAEHWAHNYSIVQGAPRSKWLDKALETLMLMHTGGFGGKFPKDYIANVPNYKALLAPMSWETISLLTAKSVRAMYRMPDYSCGSLFYPDSLDRWLLTDNRGSMTSCFLRMLSMESQAPVWTLEDLDRAPSKERALIARVKGALDETDVKQLTTLHRSFAEPIQSHTYWGRVGQVAAWLHSSEVQATRDQFGDQSDRPPRMMHATKWDEVARLPALIGKLCVYNGLWRGWFAVPGEMDFRGFLGWLAMDTGAYLYSVPRAKRQKAQAPALSGVPAIGGANEVYLGDIENNS
jgi:hypothetical protein